MAAPTLSLSHEQAKLLEDHHRMIWFSARRFYAVHRERCDMIHLNAEDLYGIGLDATLKARYRPDRGSPGTFIAMVCFRVFANELRRRHTGGVECATSIEHKPYGGGDNPSGGAGGRDSASSRASRIGDQLCDPAPPPGRRLETAELVNIVLGCLTDRERAILHMRADDRTLESIGQTLGLTRERIRQILKAIEVKARRILDIDQKPV